MKSDHLPDFTIRMVDHKHQVSPAVLASFEPIVRTGDWFLRISRAKKLHYEAGWAIHELSEILAMILHDVKVDIHDVGKFYEQHADSVDPGSLMGSPNHDEHVIALKVERAFIEALGYSWEEYYNDKTPLENEKGRESCQKSIPNLES